MLARWSAFQFPGRLGSLNESLALWSRLRGSKKVVHRADQSSEYARAGTVRYVKLMHSIDPAKVYRVQPGLCVLNARGLNFKVPVATLIAIGTNVSLKLFFHKEILR